MRFSILFVVVAWLISPALALAEPKVAVAPLEGDSDGKVDAIVRDAAASTAKVTSAKAVTKALKDLSISDPDTEVAAKRLRKHLAVDAVIYGKLEQDGGKKKLSVRVYTRGKKPDKFAIEYKLSSSKAFRDRLRDELANRLAPDDSGNDDDAEPAHQATHEPTHTASTSTRTAASDDDGTSTHVHKHAHRKTVDAERDGLTQAAVFADAGIGGEHRSLSYEANAGGIRPPPVGTASFAYQVEGEIYPGAFDSLDGPGAGLGAYGWLNQVAGLSIAIPGATQNAPISATSYAVGVRYRFVFGQSSLAAGLSYWTQSFVADRSTLTSPTELNMPDTAYKAVAPGVLLRVAASPTIGLAVQADLPLMLSSGPITDATYFGAASVLSFALQGSVDVALARHYALHFSGFFDQEGLSFKAGTMSSATDRTMGGSVALALMY